MLFTESVLDLLFGVIGIGMFWYVCFGVNVCLEVGLIVFRGAGVGGTGVEVARTGVAGGLSFLESSLISLESLSFASGEFSFIGSIFLLGVLNDRNCGQSERHLLLLRSEPNFFRSSFSFEFNCGPTWLLVEPYPEEPPNWLNWLGGLVGGLGSELSKPGWEINKLNKKHTKTKIIKKKQQIFKPCKIIAKINNKMSCGSSSSFRLLNLAIWGLIKSLLNLSGNLTLFL